MGSHIWTEKCLYCGFEDMVVSSYDTFYFEATCPICGYARWTEERIPDEHDIELAKRAISKMSAEEKIKAIELYDEDNFPLVARLKG